MFGDIDSGFMVERFIPREEPKAKIIYGTVEVNVPVKDEAPVYVKDKDFIPLDVPLDAEIQAIFITYVKLMKWISTL